MTRQQWVIAAVAGLLTWGAFLVLGPFLPAIGWAAVLALVSWPIYQWFYLRLGRRSLYAAIAMTLLLSLAVILPVVLIAGSLTSEAINTYKTLQAGGLLNLESLKENYSALGTAAAKVPLVGEQLRNWLGDVDLVQIQQWLRAGAGQILGFLSGTGQTVTQALATLGLSAFTIFFFYLSGLDLVRQLRIGLDRLGGEPLVSLLDPLSATVRAVVLGLVLTAVAQGFLAGIGIWATGIRLALLLGVAAALLSIVQVPTPIVWFPCVVYLALNGQTLQAVGLFVWGVVVVGTIDNVIKPVFISQGTGIPFLLVFFGVLGGLIAFGTLGIVLGPVILSLLLTLWRRWTDTPEPVADIVGQAPQPAVK